MCALSICIRASAIIPPPPPVSDPPVGGAISQPNYALPVCAKEDNNNVGVFWIMLPGTAGKHARDVWHRASSFDETKDPEDPTDHSAHAHQNRKDAVEKFDLFFKGSYIPPTGNVMVRVVAPSTRNYRFYVNEVNKGAEVYGVGAVDPAQNALCRPKGNFPKTHGNFYVTSFVIIRDNLAIGNCVDFNIVIESKTGTHQNVGYLDPKVHNDGLPLVC